MIRTEESQHKQRQTEIEKKENQLIWIFYIVKLYREHYKATQGALDISHEEMIYIVFFLFLPGDGQIHFLFLLLIERLREIEPL